jgi:putative addiction module component (TIGR02574 family)
MPSLADLEPQVLALDHKERAQLATTLLASLPPDCMGDEEDYQYPDDAEVVRRLQEAESDPSATISAEEFDANIRAWMARR